MFMRRFRIGKPLHAATCDWCDDVPAVLSAWADGREDGRACVTHASYLPCYVIGARAAARRVRRDPYGLRAARKRDRAVRHRCGQGLVTAWVTYLYHRWRGDVAALRLGSAEMFTRWRARFIARAARHGQARLPGIGPVGVMP